MMPNFNDAEITSLYVSEQSSPGVPADAPNAPAGGPFTLTLEMVAGGALEGADYTLTISCSDLTATKPAPSLTPQSPSELNGPGTFGKGTGWASAGQWAVFSGSTQIGPEPASDQGHVYQYTASLYRPNGQVVSLRQSDPFILI